MIVPTSAVISHISVCHPPMFSPFLFSFFARGHPAPSPALPPTVPNLTQTQKDRPLANVVIPAASDAVVEVEVVIKKTQNTRIEARRKGTPKTKIEEMRKGTPKARIKKTRKDRAAARTHEGRP